MANVGVGSLVADRYRVEKVIGAGGYGRVYLSVDERMGRRVALKVLYDADSDSAAQARFDLEAKVLGQLQSPHIVRLFDYGRLPDGSAFLVSEFLDGRSLREILDEEWALAEGRVVRILAQLLEALALAHQAEVLHRDLKPANIMLRNGADGRERATLIDFGIARVAALPGNRITAANRIVGTVRYMSPEQMFGEPLTPASDLYSLGLLTIELLTGQPFFTSSDPAEVARFHAEKRSPSAPSHEEIQISPEFRSFLERLTAADPQSRTAPASKALEELQPLLDSHERRRPKARTLVEGAKRVSGIWRKNVSDAEFLASLQTHGSRGSLRRVVGGGVILSIACIAALSAWLQAPDPTHVPPRRPSVMVSAPPPVFDFQSTETVQERVVLDAVLKAELAARRCVPPEPGDPLPYGFLQGEVVGGPERPIIVPAGGSTDWLSNVGEPPAFNLIQGSLGRAPRDFNGLKRRFCLAGLHSVFALVPSFPWDHGPTSEHSMVTLHIVEEPNHPVDFTHPRVVAVLPSETRRAGTTRLVDGRLVRSASRIDFDPSSWVAPASLPRQSRRFARKDETPSSRTGYRNRTPSPFDPTGTLSRRPPGEPPHPYDERLIPRQPRLDHPAIVIWWGDGVPHAKHELPDALGCDGRLPPLRVSSTVEVSPDTSKAGEAHQLTCERWSCRAEAVVCSVVRDAPADGWLDLRKVGPPPRPSDALIAETIRQMMTESPFD